MSDLTLGTPVTSSDEPIGRLTGLVCDPTTIEITDLIVTADADAAHAVAHPA